MAGMTQKRRFLDVNPITLDVAIVGAGPAGSTAALALTGSGLRVGLIDQATFPRDKTCGDAVAAYVPKVLATISPAFQQAFEQLPYRQPVSTCRVVAPNGIPLDFRFSETGNIIRRVDLDNFLFSQAIAQPHVNAFCGRRVTDVTRTSQGWEIETSQELFLAKLVIGCDGAQSVVTRKLSDGRLLPMHYSAAVRGYYTGVTGTDPNVFELHFIDGFRLGYFWIFPEYDGTCNVGVGGLSDYIARNSLNLRELLQKLISTHPSISPRFTSAQLISSVKGFGLPLGSRTIPISGEGWMLCGDAAHLIDPLTGEGIGQAMVSGRYAGWKAAECFAQQNFSSSFMKGYDRQVYAKFSTPNRKSYLLQRYLVPQFWLFNRVAKWAHRFPAFHRWIQRAVL
jgi:geranylgeranyl reductase family protein